MCLNKVKLTFTGHVTASFCLRGCLSICPAPHCFTTEYTQRADNIREEGFIFLQADRTESLQDAKAAPGWNAAFKDAPGIISLWLCVSPPSLSSTHLSAWFASNNDLVCQHQDVFKCSLVTTNLPVLQYKNTHTGPTVKIYKYIKNPNFPTMRQPISVLSGQRGS